jgi:hypothetical protein
MRFLLSLLLLILIGLTCCTRQALAQRRQQSEVRPVPPPAQNHWLPHQEAPPGHYITVTSRDQARPVVAFPKASRVLRLTVEGSLQTDEKKAYDDALDAAREELKAQLRVYKPDHHWDGPSRRQLDQFVVGRDTRTPETLDKDDFKDLGKKVYRTRLTLEIPESFQQKMLKAIRLEEAGDRQLGLSRWMLGAIVLLLVFAAYFRLDDATKGYYSGWLKLAALGIVAAVGVGLLVWS